MTTTAYVGSAYLRSHMKSSNLMTAIAKVTEFLSDHDEQYDAIAFRGMSGALVAPAAAAWLAKDLILVRKEGEVSSHTHVLVEGPLMPQRVLVIDDFVSTGNTLAEIQSGVKTLNPANKLVGIYLYNRDQGSFSRENDSWHDIPFVNDPHSEEVSW